MRDVTVREGFIPVMRGRVWYRVASAVEGTPLLMLQGGTVAASGYFPSLLAMAEERPVVLYEQLEGQHLSGMKEAVADATVSREAGFARFLRDVDQAQSVLGTCRMHVLGHSWGALLAFEYALHQPDAVASLIVDLVEPPRLSLRAGRSEQPHFSMVEKLAELSRSGKLQQIDVPALLICSRRADCLPELTDWYQGLMPGAELLTLCRPEGVHRPEDGAQFLGAVSEFLRRAEGRDGLARDVPRWH